MADVGVVNLFENSVWRDNISDSAGIRVKCVPLKEFDQLKSVVKHINGATSLKLWFRTENFVRTVLGRLPILPT